MKGREKERNRRDKKGFGAIRKIIREQPNKRKKEKETETWKRERNENTISGNDEGRDQRGEGVKDEGKTASHEIH